MGIEPTSSAWEAEVIPLYDTRTTCPDTPYRKDIILSSQTVVSNQKRFAIHRQSCANILRIIQH